GEGEGRLGGENAEGVGGGTRQRERDRVGRVRSGVEKRVVVGAGNRALGPRTGEAEEAPGGRFPGALGGAGRGGDLPQGAEAGECEQGVTTWLSRCAVALHSPSPFSGSRVSPATCA